MKRQVLRVTRTRRAIRAEEEAVRKQKARERDFKLIMDGTVERFAERGIDLLAQPRIPSADGGAGREQEQNALDTRTSSETVSDHIRDIWNDPARQAERRRLKHGGSHDAKDVPEDAPAAVSHPRVPWEDR